MKDCISHLIQFVLQEKSCKLEYKNNAKASTSQNIKGKNAMQNLPHSQHLKMLIKDFKVLI